ncbi:MAG: hypothetical protein VW891_14510, partial [Novosphingobium sp.]
MMPLRHGRWIQNLGLRFALMGWVTFAALPAQAALTPIDGGSYGPLLEYAYALRSNENPARLELTENHKSTLLDEFSTLEALLGTEAYLVTVDEGASLSAVALAAACATAPNQCQDPAVLEQISSLSALAEPSLTLPEFDPFIIDTEENAVSISFENEGRLVIITLVPHRDGFINERAQAAIRGYASAFFAHAATLTDGAPPWWNDGAARYLAASSLAYFRVDDKMTDYLNAASFLIGSAVGRGDSLDVTADHLPAVNFSLIVRLINQYGERAVLLDFPSRMTRIG